MHSTEYNSRFCLCEVKPNIRADEAYRLLTHMRSLGYTPILAHPERYGFFQEDVHTADALRRMNIFLQIDKDSVFGMFGRKAALSAQRLPASRKVDFIASDAHSPYVRTPDLSQIHEWVSDHYSFDYAEYLLKVNPLRVLRNEDIHFL